jgi:CRP-like cAMP-binding protein
MSEETTFKRQTYPANRTIFDEGDQADSVYVLSNGAVEIRVGTLSDNPRTLTVVKIGDVFGEMALLQDRRHHAAAITLEESEVLEVPREEFIDRLNAADPVMRAVVNHLVSRLSEMTVDFKKRGKPSY